MNRPGLGILLLAATACDTGGPTELGATTVTLTLRALAGLERPESLRLAVVFRTGEASATPWLTTFDRDLSDPQGSHRVRVELPEGVNLRELPDPVSITLQCEQLNAGSSFPGVRPLLVAYEDLNRNQRLDDPESDRVWATTDFTRNHLAAFADFEKALSQVSLEGAECLRRAVGGGFSPFVSGYGVTFLASSSPTFGLELLLNPTEFSGALLTCGPSIQYPSLRPGVVEPTLLKIAADFARDACTDEANPCTRVGYENDWGDAIQALSLPGYERSASCVTAGDLEVLWVRERRQECEGCDCVQHFQSRGWVVSRAAPPLGWPCRDSVTVCAKAADRVEVVPYECWIGG